MFLEANDLYNGYSLLKNPGTYRLVALYNTSGESGLTRDTLVSNSFDIR